MKYQHQDIAKAFVSQADKVGVKRATKDLAALMLEQRIHGDVEGILQNIASEYAKTKGIVEAKIVSAQPLSNELKKQLEDRVKTKTGAKKVIVEVEMDRSLLGGVILTVPGMELDLSLKSKLSKLGVK